MNNKIDGGLRTRGLQKKSAPDKLLISIVTVVFNGEKYLAQAIRSVLGQDYGNIEYIIIDGGSTDKTLDIIRANADKIDYWVSEPDKGIYDAMNKGIALAHGDVIGLLNSDDWYEAGALRAVAEAYRRLDGPVMLVGDAFIIQQDMGIRYHRVSNLRFWSGFAYPHQALFVPNEVYRRFGGYDLRYRMASDYDFVTRALAAGVALQRIESTLVNYRLGGRSNSKPLVTLNELRVINRRYYGRFSVSYLKFLALFSKSAVLEALQRVIRLLLGERTLVKLRTLYMKKVIARRWERL